MGVAIIATVAVKCRSALVANGGARKDRLGNEAAGDGAGHRRSSNTIDLKENDMTQDFSSSTNSGKTKDNEERTRKDHAASRESLLSYQGSSEGLKDSPRRGGIHCELRYC